MVDPLRGNIAEFTVDSQDPKQPDTPFALFVYVSNPEFTPDPNWWKFDIQSPLGKIFDTREWVAGFDITGKVAAEIKPGFAYIGERNPLSFVFVQSTIMNQADVGNELVLDAPVGWTFPENCTKNFGLRLTDARAPSSDSEYPDTFTFPPAGVECTGWGNETVVIRMPDGSGLLRNNYTLLVEVDNPGYSPNVTIPWRFVTRVRPPGGGERIVDMNIAVPGFTMRELLPLRTDEGGAPCHLSLLWCFLSLMSLLRNEL